MHKRYINSSRQQLNFSFPSESRSKSEEIKPRIDRLVLVIDNDIGHVVFGLDIQYDSRPRPIYEHSSTCTCMERANLTHLL